MKPVILGKLCFAADLNKEPVNIAAPTLKTVTLPKPRGPSQCQQNVFSEYILDIYNIYCLLYILTFYPLIHIYTHTHTFVPFHIHITEH